jgi:predicted O-methyltransferase YrrM
MSDTAIEITTLQRIVDIWPLDPRRDLPILCRNRDRSDLARLFATLGFRVGVEVGVAHGLYARVLCAANPLARIYGVDPWRSWPDYYPNISDAAHQQRFEKCTKYLRGFLNWAPLRMTSVEAARNFVAHSVDFVYLDGNHKYDHVVEDLETWIPKIRPGGIISGHDFFLPKMPTTGYLESIDVMQAVYDYTRAHRIDPWFVVGSNDRVVGEARDRVRSFFWVVT